MYRHRLTSICWWFAVKRVSCRPRPTTGETTKSKQIYGKFTTSRTTSPPKTKSLHSTTNPCHILFNKSATSRCSGVWANFDTGARNVTESNLAPFYQRFSQQITRPRHRSVIFTHSYTSACNRLRYPIFYPCAIVLNCLNKRQANRWLGPTPCIKL